MSGAAGRDIDEPGHDGARSLAWVETGRTVACALVVLVHVNQYTRPGMNTWWPGGMVLAPIYSLAVPFFFLVSGYFAVGREPDGGAPAARASFRRRFPRLAVPFVLWNALLLALNPDGTALTPGLVLFHLATGYWQLYYIAALLQFLALAAFLGPRLRRVPAGWMLGGAAVLTLSYYGLSDLLLWSGQGSPLGFEDRFDRLFAGWSLFFTIGWCLRLRPGSVESLARKAFPLLLLGAACHLLYYSGLRAEEIRFGYHPREQILLAGLPYQVVGSLALAALLIRLHRWGRGAALAAPLAARGGLTYGIFLSHTAALTVIYAALLRSGLGCSQGFEAPILGGLTWASCEGAIRLVRRLGLRRAGFALFGAAPAGAGGKGTMKRVLASALLMAAALPAFTAHRCRAAGADDDEAVIRLDPGDTTIDLWKIPRDTSGDPKREPGPITLQRFPGGPAYAGIPTFFRQPAALTPEDLKAGKVDVAVMGAPLDMSSGMRGAAFGPQALRTSEAYLPWGPAVPLPHAEVRVDPFAVLRIVDYGDAPVDPFSTERSVEPIRAMVREIAAAGAVPFIVGGDHSLMYPDLAAMADVYGRGNVGVVHLDAHGDAAGAGLGHRLTHGMPVRRLIEEGHVSGKRFIQVGLRGYSPDEETLEWMRRKGIRFHSMEEAERLGWNALADAVSQEARDGPGLLYISLDIDVLDPAFAPGTGAPEPGGLTTRELFPLLRRLCAENRVVGFELVELNPLADPARVTALNANRAIRECLAGIALRKKAAPAERTGPAR